MKKSFLLSCLTIILMAFMSSLFAQEKLYYNEFPLKDVTLLDSPFKYARDLNIETLLKYDVDRLLAGYRKEAGLTSKAKSYANWDGLDGHIGGHYLSAMAINYAATGSLECKKRMDYMIAELNACQVANSITYPDWVVGYVGAVPNSNVIWSTFKTGNFKAFSSSWVPWYNVHKMYAGLRDAWLYTGNKDAKAIFLKFCDWGINITSALTDDQMQSMLGTEHGGMNEVFADAYQMTGNGKYLIAAKRFSHNMLLDAMSVDNDNLDNKHANTQVPKAIGFERIAELSKDKKYGEAGSFFWETVTGNRTLAFGGNSRREIFPSAASCIDFVNDVEGPESCNTYNMLKLTEDLFRVSPKAKYVDFYEKALYNHILSTQHPEHGGYVYFTPARPRHYRVYSAPNEAMWCCVGSGMENHGKYNQFIYTHQHDSLFLNLFIPSQLDWKEKGIILKQETKFPSEEQVKLTIIKAASSFKLQVRYPSWVKDGALKVIINDKVVSYTSHPSSYISINRKWKAGDVVKILLPMHNSIVKMINMPNYVAIMHGPILLGAKTGTEDLKGLVANDSRWGHIAGGEKLPVDKAPIIIEDEISRITDKLVPVKDKPLNFTISGVKLVNAQNVELMPFYQIHDSRYEIYWMNLTNAQYKNSLDSLATLEKEKLVLQNRTVDFVAPGEQQPEVDHDANKQNSSTGNNQNEFWRDARNGGYFSYKLSTNKETALNLMVRYWGAEVENKKFDIFIDDEKLISEDVAGKWNKKEFKNVEYRIPESMLKGKDFVRVKFVPQSGSIAGPVYYVRLLKAAK